MDPPLVDSTYERSITDDDMPLIIVCPTKQLDVYFKNSDFYNREMLLDEIGYSNLEDLLMGIIKCNDERLCLSWGQNLNLTFDELKNKAFDLNTKEVFQKDGGDITGNATMFIPGYGLCTEISFFNISQQLVLFSIYEYDSTVFITDKDYRSYFMPDISSHVGSKIHMHFSRNQNFHVRIQVRTHYNKGEVQMTRNEYEKCVDDKIQKEFEEHNISCVPPWLSKNKQCVEIYSQDFFSIDYLH